jgi:hypothetical protein
MTCIVLATDHLLLLEPNTVYWVHENKVGEHDLVLLRDIFGFGLNDLDFKSPLCEETMKLAHVAYFSRRRFSFLFVTAPSFSGINPFKVSLNEIAKASCLRLALVTLWPLGRDGRGPLLRPSFS